MIYIKSPFLPLSFLVKSVEKRELLGGLLALKWIYERELKAIRTFTWSFIIAPFVRH